MLRWTVCLLAGITVAAIALPADAQWKWRDKAGRWQYSDLPPPPDIADKDIVGRPPGARTARTGAGPVAAGAASAASAPAPALPRAGEPELEAKRKAAEQAEADKRKADEAKLAAARAENCSRAREQLRTLDSGIRIARVNAQGEREVLDDAARAESTRRAREAVASECR